MLQNELADSVERHILTGKDEGLEVFNCPIKGRGVKTRKVFKKGEYVAEYKGDFISLKEAKRRLKNYEKDAEIGSYMYYFKFEGKSYW